MLTINQLSGFGSGSLNSEVALWRSRVLAAGGTLAADSVGIAIALSNAMRSRLYSSKIIYLLPLLGSNLAASRVPLRDKLNVGIASNTNCVDADFSQSTGIHGNGVDKSLGTGFKPSQIGSASSNNGGLGVFVQNAGTPGNTQIGIFSTASGGELYSLSLDADNERFWWGNGTSVTGTNNSAIKAHYYGQRASTTDRKLFRNGSLIASNTASGATVAGIADRNFTLLDLNGIGSNHSADVVGFAYATDGTLDNTQVADFDSLLSTYIITPTGR